MNNMSYDDDLELGKFLEVFWDVTSVWKNAFLMPFVVNLWNIFTIMSIRSRDPRQWHT